jgi:hypothetical protein
MLTHAGDEQGMVTITGTGTGTFVTAYINDASLWGQMIFDLMLINAGDGKGTFTITFVTTFQVTMSTCEAKRSLTWCWLMLVTGRRSVALPPCPETPVISSSLKQEGTAMNRLRTANKRNLH